MVAAETNEMLKSIREVRRSSMPRVEETQFIDHRGQEWNLYDPTTNIVGQQHGVSR
jgi:hypothetical protein